MWGERQVRGQTPQLGSDPALGPARRVRTLCRVPRSWQISMVLLVLALLASMVIATVKLV